MSKRTSLTEPISDEDMEDMKATFFGESDN
jgi:hypothetical protein